MHRAKHNNCVISYITPIINIIKHKNTTHTITFLAIDRYAIITKHTTTTTTTTTNNNNNDDNGHAAGHQGG